MSNQMTFVDFFEEMTKLPNTDFRTLSLMNLMNQNMTNTNNLTMSSDETEYIEVILKEDSHAVGTFNKSYSVDTFNDLFIKQAKHYNILIEWLVCSSKKCKHYYLESQEQDLRHHIQRQHFANCCSDPP